MQEVNQLFSAGMINFTMAFAAMMLCIVCGISIYINRRTNWNDYKLLIWICVLNFFLALSFAAEIVFTEYHTVFYVRLVWIAALLEFEIPYILSTVLTTHLFVLIDERNGRVPLRKVIYIVTGIILAFTLIMSINGTYYIVTLESGYDRGPGFEISQYIGFILIGLNFFYIFYRENKITTVERIIYILYFLSPMIAAILQMLVQELSFMVPATTISIIILIFYVQNKTVAEYYESERQLANVKITLLLSQLRPHFLYNALSSISQLCKKDPKRASGMTDCFAEFLRKNMNDIKNNEPIPFEKELHHIQNYIAIEQMRYEDLISVEYDIQYTDFEVPALVMQPIVENAIVHGLYPKEEGGTIRISTRIVSGMVVLTIADDGVGFETNRFSEAGKNGKKSIKTEKKNSYADQGPHLGMDSVQKRIGKIPHASFMITSIPGVGTTAVFLLPRKLEPEAHKDRNPLKLPVINDGITEHFR